MRLLPRSLLGRLTLVLLTGLTVTVLLSAWVQMRDRGQIIYQGIHTDLIQRTVGIVQLMNALQPEERDRLLPLLSTPQTRIGLTEAPMELPQADAQSGVAAELVHLQLHELLGDDSEIRVALEGSVMAGPMASMRHRHMMGRADAHDAASAMHGTHAMARLFFIQVRLRDGSWVWFERQVPRALRLADAPVDHAGHSAARRHDAVLGRRSLDRAATARASPSRRCPWEGHSPSPHP